jgi:hypothetical protein
MPEMFRVPSGLHLPKVVSLAGTFNQKKENRMYTPTDSYAVYSQGSNSLQHLPVFTDESGKQYIYAAGDYKEVSTVDIRFVRFEKAGG